jgi:hypothetical protein
MNKVEMQKLVQLQLDAYNRRDLEKFCECYHHEVVVTYLVSDRLPTKGIEAFKKIYRENFKLS